MSKPIDQEREAFASKLNSITESLLETANAGLKNALGQIETLRTENARLVAELEQARASAPPAGVAVPDMPPTQDRRPYDDEDPDGYLEGNNDWAENNNEAVEWLADNHAAIRLALAAAPHPVCGEPKPRPTGLSRGWNLTRQVDGFVIGHSSEEPSDKSKAQALLDGRVYVPFLTAAAAPPTSHDVARLVEALEQISKMDERSVLGSIPPIRQTQAIAMRALAAHRAQHGEQKPLHSISCRRYPAGASVVPACRSDCPCGAPPPYQAQ